MARYATLPLRHIEGFEWDEGNQSELAEHHICEREAEQVFFNNAVWLKNKRKGSGDRFMVGMTDGGRFLTLVVQIKRQSRTLRIITGWDSGPEQIDKYRGQRSH